MNMKAKVTLDAKGLACPMPIVKTRNEMKTLTPGNVLEVQATDRGSTADMEAWAKSTGHHYLGTIEEEDMLKHYIRKSSREDDVPTKHPHIAKNEEVSEKIAANEDMVVLDVREAAEYAFSHIPEAKNIPLGELEARVDELSKEKEVYIICRTGNRSDVAARQLTDIGFSKVYNIIPGMSQWEGKTEGRL